MRKREELPVGIGGSSSQEDTKVFMLQVSSVKTKKRTTVRSRPYSIHNGYHVTMQISHHNADVTRYCYNILMYIRNSQQQGNNSSVLLTFHPKVMRPLATLPTTMNESTHIGAMTEKHA